MVAMVTSAAALLTLVGGSGALPGTGSTSMTSSSTVAAPTGTSYQSGFDMKKSWGNLSPYADAPSFNLPKGFPQGCELLQVHILHRHGQRYPTDSTVDAGSMEAFASALQNASRKHPGTKIGTGPLAFLNDWDYLLGVEDLLPTGAATEATSGANFWSKYGRLLYGASIGEANWNKTLNEFPNGKPRPKPVFRTTSYPRILESARWWLSGFFTNIGANSSYPQYELVIIPEQSGFNNTLSSTDTCTKGLITGAYAAAEFIPAMIKTAATRFAPFLPEDFFSKSAEIAAEEVLGMFNLCPYEYTTLGSSSFCSLFTEQEWRDFEYYLDLQYYDMYGFGSPSGRAQGIGYVQELAARLQHKLIQSSDSSINSTYDDNEKYFPLDQPLFMDMSHDDTIISVLTALGLDFFKYNPKRLPSTVAHAPKRHFKLNEITPFGAHLMYKNRNMSSRSDTEKYIRLVLNNAPIPWDGLSACDGSVNGFCPVQSFISQVPQLTKQAMFQEACFGSYNTSIPVNNGQPPLE
ncbi:Histidine phosphatase superfamily clade-2 [Penicillium expansum]|nr:Histidine phosphatase superfamily clade-2 [Penicillium expansum]